MSVPRPDPASRSDPASGPTPAGRRWLADLAWLPGHGLARDVLIEADAERFISVTPDAQASADAVRLPGDRKSVV